MHLLLLGAKRELMHSALQLASRITVLYEPWEEQRLAPFRSGIAHTCAVDSYHSVESLLSALEHVGALAQPIDAVVAVGETGVAPAAILARLIGARALDVDVALRCRDKALQKRAWHAAGVPTARCAVIPDAAALPEDVLRLAAAAGISAPYVFKPLALHSTRNVAIARSDAELQDKVKTAVAEEPAMRRLLIEEFTAGEEWHLDGCCFNGRLESLCMSKYLQPVIENRVGGCVASVSYRPHANPELYERGRRFVSAAVRALGLESGVFHFEAFAEPGTHDFVAGELGARPAGFFITPVLKRFLDLDLWDAHLRVNLGLPPRAYNASNEEAWGFAHLPSQAGKRNRVRADDVMSIEGVAEVHVLTPLDGEMRDMTGNSTVNIGYALVRGPDEQACEQTIRRVQARVWNIHHGVPDACPRAGGEVSVAG
jgi:biotin carboxylase